MMERLSQQRAGGMNRVWQVVDFNPDGRKVALQAVALLSAPPVISLEDDVERVCTPSLELARNGLDDGLVDIDDVLHDLEAFGGGNDGRFALGQLCHLIGDDARDQIVTALSRPAEDVEMPDMEEIVDTRGIADPVPHDPPYPRTLLGAL